MARFYAEIQGNRGVAARQGNKDSGLWSHIRGWNVGVEIFCRADGAGDRIEIYRTSGSNGTDKERKVAVLRSSGKDDLPQSVTLICRVWYDRDAFAYRRVSIVVNGKYRASIAASCNWQDDGLYWLAEQGFVDYGPDDNRAPHLYCSSMDIGYHREEIEVRLKKHLR